MNINIKAVMITALVLGMFAGILYLVSLWPALSLTVLTTAATCMFAVSVFNLAKAYLTTNKKENNGN